MSQPTILSQRPIGPGSELRSFVGADPAGRRLAWLGYLPGEGPERETNAGLPAPLHAAPGLADDVLHAALSHVPAWRLTRLASLEPGGVALVVGDGWLAQDVLEICRLRGCLWRGLWGRRPSADAEWWAGESQPLVTPRPLDAAILLRISGAGLDACATVVRDRGVIVVAAEHAGRIDHSFYPHAHRRGLRLEFADLAVATDEDLQAVLRLVRLGLSPGS